MNSVEQKQLNFETSPLIKAVGAVVVEEALRQPLRDSLEAINPAFGKLAGCIVDQNTKGLRPKSAEIIGNSFYRTLLSLEESLHSTMSVLLSERAENLLLTLDAISRNHSLGGLDMASEPDSKYIPELLEYFKTSRDGLDNIKENSANKRPRLYASAKRHFADSIGHKLVAESGLIDAEDNDDITSYDFLKFVGKYYISPGAETERSRYRKRLKKYLPKS